MRILLVVALLLASVPASAAKRAVAVRDLKNGEGVTPTMAATLTEAVATELRRLPDLKVNTQQEILATLSLDQQKQLLSCEDNQCVADFGGALGVSAMVTGNLGRLGESWLVNLKLIDVVSVAVIAQSDRRLRGGTLDDVLDALPGMAGELFGLTPVAEKQVNPVAPAPSTTTVAPPLYTPQPIVAPPAAVASPPREKALAERFPGTGRFLNGAKKLCLDVQGYGGEPGKNVMLFGCDGGKDQTWTVDGALLRNGMGKGILDVAGTDAASGRNVQLGRVDAAQDQTWRFVEMGNDWVELRDASTGLCLDVSGYDGKARDNVQLWACEQKPDQLWFWEVQE